MKLTFFGVGYVGLVTGVCLAEVGHDVICYDINEKRIEDLNKGIIPIYEPGLDELVKKNHKKGRVKFTADLSEAIAFSDVYFIGVGTPSSEDGSADMCYVESCVASIAELVQNDNFIVVIKSTVPVGTSDWARGIIQAGLDKRGVKLSFSMASNPEFLREGTSVSDFMNPDRIVVGADNEHTKKILDEVYEPFGKGKVVNCDIRTSEISKYAANTMLASRISFMNELSRLCSKTSADIEVVKNILGLDLRIGPRYLNPGLGYGGSCLPKDVKALIYAFKQNNIDPIMLESIHKTNNEQENYFYSLIKDAIKGKEVSTIGVLGVAFKLNTDDTRDSMAVKIIDRLTADNFDVVAYDPKVKDLKNFNIVGSPEEVFGKTEIIIITTDWPEFRELILAKVKSGKKLTIVDGRNLFTKDDFTGKEVEYYSIGRPPLIGTDLFVNEGK